VKFHGHSIADILELTIEDALTVLADVRRCAEAANPGRCRPGIRPSRPERDHALRRRGAAHEAGAGAEQAPDRPHALSARRADHRPALRRCAQAARVLHRLADLGNTVIIIEHNLDVIRNADWILDLGPEAAKTAAAWLPRAGPQRSAASASYTGQFLKRYYTPATAVSPRQSRR